MVVFFVTIALVAACLVVSGWIGVNFKNQMQTHNQGKLFSRVTAVLRFVLLVICNIFFVSIINILFTPADCGKRVLVPGGERVLVMEMYPKVECGTVPGIILAGLGVLVAIIFVAMMAILEAAKPITDPMTDDGSASADPYTPVKILLAKGAFIALARYVSSFPIAMGLCLLVVSGYMVYLLVYYNPYVNRFTARLLSALHMVLAWMSLCVMMHAIVDKGANESLFTILMFAASPGAAFAGFILMERRLRRDRRVAAKFFHQEVRRPMTADEDLFAFPTPYHVESAARIVRLQRRKRKRVLVPDEVHLEAAELIYLTGLEQFPNSSWLHLCYSSFTKHIKEDDSKAQFHVEKARSTNPVIGVRYRLYVLDRESNKKTDDDVGGDAAMDLVSYLEFSNNLKVAVAAHKLALKALRDFWRVLLKSELAFKHITRAFHHLAAADLKADRAYAAVLERYPKSSKLLRSYGHFLEEMHIDPSKASRYLHEADRIDEAAAEAQEAAGFGGELAGGGKVDDTKDGIVVINKKGIIQMTNKVVSRMFGYKRDEMLGKNVRMLQPPAYAAHHDAYLAAYNSTGIAKVVGSYRDVEGRNKSGHVFPIRLYVNKVESNGEVSFMGIIRAIEEDDNAVIKVDERGLITNTNRAFTRLFGYTTTDINNKLLTILFAPKDVKSMSAVDICEGSLPGPDGQARPMSLTARHKTNTEFGVLLETTPAEEMGRKLYAVRASSLNDTLGIMAIDPKGKILNANRLIIDMFGYKESQLLKMNVNQLMPPPYNKFHAQYLQRYAKQGPSGRVIGVPGGRAVFGVHQDGTKFPMNLEVFEVRDEVTGKKMFSAKVTLTGQEDSTRRDTRVATLHLDAASDVIRAASDSTADLFQWEPHELIGRPMAMLLQLPGGKSISRMLAQASKAGDSPSWRMGALSKVGRKVWVGVVASYTDLEGINVIKCDIWLLEALEGTIGIDARGTITEVDMGMEIFFGHTIEGMTGRNVKMLMPGKYAAFHDMYLANYKASRKKKLIGTRRRVECLHRDGIIFACEVELIELNKKDMRMVDSGATTYMARFINVGGQDREVTAADMSARGGGTGLQGANDDEDEFGKAGEGEEEGEEEGGDAGAKEGEEKAAILPSGGGGAVMSDAASDRGGDAASEASQEDASGLYQRAKRFKAILKLLSSKEMQRAIKNMALYSKIIVATLFLAHLCTYLYVHWLIKTSSNYMTDMRTCGLAISQISKMLLNVRGITSRELGSQTIFDWTKELNIAIDGLSTGMRNLYLGTVDGAPSDAVSRKLQHLLEDPYLELLEWHDNNPGAYYSEFLGLFDAVRRAVEHGRLVAHSVAMGGRDNANIVSMLYLQDNCMWPIVPNMEELQDTLASRTDNHLQSILKGMLLVLAIEGGVIWLVSLVLMAYLLRRVAADRLALFSVFRYIPRPVLRGLASQPITLDVEDSDDDSDEEGKAEHEDEDEEGGKHKGRRGSLQEDEVPLNIKLSTKGRSGKGAREVTLRPDGSEQHVFLAPVLGFGLLVLLVFGVGYAMVSKEQAHVQEYNLALKESWLMTQTIAEAVELAETDITHQYPIRTNIKRLVTRLQEIHEGLLYGDKQLGLEGALFRSSERADLLFGTKCLRHNKDNCLNDTNPYYPDVTHGLDSLVQSFITNAFLFSNEASEDLSVVNPRFQFVLRRGLKELTDGLETSYMQYNDDLVSNGKIVEIVQIVVLVVVVIGIWIFYFRVLLPSMKRTQSESRSISEMLSYIPKSVSIPNIIQQVRGKVESAS
eukprot:jgi/Mesvir1/20654/Mv14872-RA.2